MTEKIDEVTDRIEDSMISHQQDGREIMEVATEDISVIMAELYRLQERETESYFAGLERDLLT